MKSSEIVRVARTHSGKDYAHLGRGENLDCMGLVVVICQELGYQVKDVFDYDRVPSNLIFKNSVEAHMDRIKLSEIEPGDCLTFHFTKEPQHIAIVTEVKPYLKIIHSYSTIGKVVEHIVDFDDIKNYWRRRFSDAYRFKNLEKE